MVVVGGGDIKKGSALKGANSFLEEFTSIKKGGKNDIGRFVSLESVVLFFLIGLVCTF